jgi:hypothetical protein
MASDGSTSIATLATRVPTRMGWVIYKPCSAMKALHGPHYSSVQCRPRHQRGMDSTSQVPRVRDILTTDAAGHILEQRDNLLHPTNSWISVVPRSTDDDAYIHQERVLLYNALSQQPEWFIGRHAHKFFREWQGICRATVTKYNKQDG